MGRWMDTKEVASRIRADLKREFPLVKFSVRLSRYAGGSSVRVTYTDGPSTERVKAVADRYEGISFDGMDDSTHYHPVTVDGEERSASAYVFVDRDESRGDEWTAEARAWIEANCAVDGVGSAARFGNYYVSDLARGSVRAWDMERETLIDAIRRTLHLGEPAPAGKE